MNTQFKDILTNPAATKRNQIKAAVCATALLAAGCSSPNRSVQNVPTVNRGITLTTWLASFKDYPQYDGADGQLVTASKNGAAEFTLLVPNKNARIRSILIPSLQCERDSSNGKLVAGGLIEIRDKDHDLFGPRSIAIGEGEYEKFHICNDNGFKDSFDLRAIAEKIITEIDPNSK